MSFFLNYFFIWELNFTKSTNNIIVSVEIFCSQNCVHKLLKIFDKIECMQLINYNICSILQAVGRLGGRHLHTECIELRTKILEQSSVPWNIRGKNHNLWQTVETHQDLTPGLKLDKTIILTMHWTLGTNHLKCIWQNV